jgi:hypothetical protein
VDWIELVQNKEEMVDASSFFCDIINRQEFVTDFLQKLEKNCETI